MSAHALARGPPACPPSHRRTRAPPFMREGGSRNQSLVLMSDALSFENKKHSIAFLKEIDSRSDLASIRV
ncbi:hypothetical protein Mapa_002347 [Marchantia paleacea]|nr:hypothetical protein Mapa_002347 [Marchantia paleacea]